MNGPVVAPRMIELDLAAPGSPGGDLLTGSGSAAGLLKESGPESDIALSRPARISSAAFTPASDRARDRLAAILNGDGILVSTGQQPGLFLGPLYVLYKIFSAISHARRIEQATGRPALASFWVAGDDHDWNEVGTAKIVSRTGEIERVSIEPSPAQARRSVGTARLGEDISARLGRFAAAAGESEFAAEALAPLRQAYVPGATFSSAFTAALAGILAGFDVALFDPAHPEVRRAAVPFYQHVLELDDGVSRAVEEGAGAVVSAGYDPTLRPPGSGIQIFYDDGRTRAHLLRDSIGLRNGDSGESRSRNHWTTVLETEPDRFSAAAALRPALESWLLPVARTVLGPGELAYWAQLGPLFRLLDVEMPETVPRRSWLLVEPRVDRWLAGLGVSAADLADGGAAVERRLTREVRPEAVDQSLERLKTDFKKNLSELARISESELPGLSAAFGKAGKSVTDVLEALERTLDGRARESQEIMISRASRAAELLYPGGQPQERIDSPVSFLVRYGSGFLPALAAAHGIVDTRGAD